MTFAKIDAAFSRLASKIGLGLWVIAITGLALYAVYYIFFHPSYIPLTNQLILSKTITSYPNADNWSISSSGSGETQSQKIIFSTTDSPSTVTDFYFDQKNQAYPHSCHSTRRRNAHPGYWKLGILDNTGQHTHLHETASETIATRGQLPDIHSILILRWVDCGHSQLVQHSTFFKVEAIAQDDGVTEVVMTYVGVGK